MSKLSSNSFLSFATFFLPLSLAFNTLSNNALAQDKAETPVSINSSQKPNTLALSSLNIPNSAKTITIDGELDDAIWADALVVPLDIVNSPWDNLPSPIKTEAKIIENGDFLYIAFIADDPEPEKIQGFLGDRDTKWSDDIVGIKLDTHNNRRLNYEFFVNPFGVQNDAIFNEITGEANDLWDGIWHSYGKITPQGYQVEIAIPYNILNFEENGEIKKWAIELLRSYPRETRLRISHVPLDRDNPCWLCQYPEAVGFEKAQTGNNVRVTPAITASKAQSKDVYNPQSAWQDDNELEAGIDLRWGIDANTSLNATINPDFSTVEADAGQLSINTTFSLFYDEKRAFFLDNSDYFDSNYDLVYTRNIVAPDYGAKLTGRSQKHSYGAFMTNDTETNFFMPGNLSSDVASLNEESHSAALRYRYDHNDDLSLGAISTLRQSSDYHNYVAGFDGRYRITDSNIIRAQVLTSQTQYPDDLFKSFCLGDECIDDNTSPNDCSFGNCAYSEQVSRSNIQGEFSDQAIKVDYMHDSEYWQVDLSHQNIGKNFRADLGYLPKIDKKENAASITRLFYGEPNSLWQQAELSGQWNMITNVNNEFIERSMDGSFYIDGPRQSALEVTLTHAEKIGLRHDDSSLAIEGNTTRFTENQVNIYSKAQLNPRLYMNIDMTFGDKIDYRNNRLGTINNVSANLTWNITNHLEFDITHTYSELNAENINNPTSGDNVYTAHLTNLLLSYQFDVQSYLKLTLVYSDIDRNVNNNPYTTVSAKNKDLSSQLIYAYKLNPQTVFFLGYSDNSYQDDYLDDLSRAERTFFSKISYSWMP
ncbi:carbohydrate binding family 9 domain-containing protein [Colwellia sp. D2M02]|uniref:carbohydrate binding family 9 domain-containing protein n=1 Tax=Colwellia sp. D2M02 TaxID=2841562 RepID=UPI001C096CB8|nr:carbohydrate binding family 9 domain-containing protein [Colwellia sp. D2M02]MBU2893862.1 carbohydrate binding family 9 domain-containing protein [Colwellia sp. D2M02]